MSAEIKEIINVDLVDKIDARVGRIINVIDVKESKKFVCLIVDFGSFQKQCLVGFKTERENPKEVIGKQAVFIVNLEPRKMCGFTSECMIYDCGFQDGIIPCLITPEKEVPNGTRLG